MFPSGLDDVDQFGAMSIADPFQALFYRLAFRQAEAPGAKVHFFCGGRQLAVEFSTLFGTKIESHPLPLCEQRQTRRSSTGRRSCLLFAGDAKEDKGFLLVPGLAERLSTSHRNWDYVIHANPTMAFGEVLEAFNRTVRIAEERPNVKLASGRLDRKEYLALLELTDGMILTYDPVIYAHKSSGVLWEAVSLEIPMLLAAGTWLEREAAEWGAGYRTFADYSVEGIAGEFATFASQIQALGRKSQKAAARFHAHNGAGPLMNHLGRLWASRLAAASLVAQPTVVTLPMEEVSSEGWSYLEQHDGRAARWTGQEFDVSFAWPYASPWNLRLSVAGSMGEEQLLKARGVLGSGQELPLGAQISGKGGCLTTCGPGPGREAPQVQVRVMLPWTYRPDTETRDLGVFVDGIVISPAESATGPGTARTMEVLSPLTVSADGDAFALEDTVSGEALPDPRTNALVRFGIRSDAGPPVVRSVRLFVNGVAVPLKYLHRGEGEWAASGECNAGLLSSGGYRTEWDLVLEQRGKGPVWIADLALGDCRLALKAPSVPGADRQILPAVKIPPVEQPERAPQIPSTIVVQAMNAGLLAEAGDVRLDEVYDRDAYRHLDLSMDRLAFLDGQWPHVKLKICWQNNETYVEFRRMPGWPEMFVQWPSEERDEFGDVWRIGGAVGAGELKLAVERDRLLLQAIAILLQNAVEAVLARAKQRPDFIEFWSGEAQKVARFLLGWLKKKR